MVISRYLIVAMLLIASIKSVAQENTSTWADGSISIGKMGSTAAFGIEKIHKLGSKKQFNFGYGARLTSYYSKNKALKFRTAPAKLTSGKTSIVALFSEDINSQIDTLNFKNLQVNSINLFLDLGYNISPKISLGFNIDAIGFSFGKKQNAIFEANISDSEGLNNNSKSIIAKPTALNLLLVSDSDIGSLNSEIYTRVNLNSKLALRAGACFQFIEYTAEENLAFNNNRFRMKQLMPFLAISFKL